MQLLPPPQTTLQHLPPFMGKAKKSPFLVIFLFTSVWKSVKILACLPVGKRKTPAGAGYSGEPHVVSHRVART